MCRHQRPSPGAGHPSRRCHADRHADGSDRADIHRQRSSEQDGAFGRIRFRPQPMAGFGQRHRLHTARLPAPFPEQPSVAGGQRQLQHHLPPQALSGQQPRPLRDAGPGDTLHRGHRQPGVVSGHHRRAVVLRRPPLLPDDRRRPHHPLRPARCVGCPLAGLPRRCAAGGHLLGPAADAPSGRAMDTGRESERSRPLGKDLLCGRRVRRRLGGQQGERPLPAPAEPRPHPCDVEAVL